MSTGLSAEYRWSAAGALLSRDEHEASAQATWNLRDWKAMSRRDAALAWQAHPHKAVLFKMLDGRPYADLIWKAVKPERHETFRVDAG